MDLDIHPPLPRRRNFRIGIVGAGFIVRDCHLVAYRKAGFNPVAIASRTRAHADAVARQHGIPGVYETPEQLLDDPAIEVLDIAVPPPQQLPLIRAACARRTLKGILAQKPLGMNYAEAIEAVQACESAGITLAVNQNMRYDQSVRAAATLLRNGTLGTPVFATIDMRGIPHWMEWHKDLGWLTLRIMSIHHLDTFRYWFGDPEGIYCSVRTDPRTPFPHTDGICSYILEYANGLRCVGIDDTWTGPAREGCPGDIRIQWRVEGTNGLAIGDLGWCKDPYTTPSTIRYAAKGMPGFQCPAWTESWFPDAFIGTMAQLLVALETGREPAVSGRDNLKTMALVEAAYLSAATFKSIDPATVVPHRTPAPDKAPATAGSFFKSLFSAPQFFEPASTKGVWRDFTPRAERVLALARAAAERRNQNFIGTEHLLLGLLELGQGVAVRTLQKMGVDLEMVRAEVAREIRAGQSVVGPIAATPRVKKVLALAANEAEALRHTFVGTEHIFLGLLREGDGVAARVLVRLGVGLESTRAELLRVLDPNNDEPNPSSGSDTQS